MGLHKTPLEVAFPVAFGIGILSGVVTIPIVPRLKQYVSEKLENSTNDIELPAIEDEVKTNRHELNIKNEEEL